MTQVSFASRVIAVVASGRSAFEVNGRGGCVLVAPVSEYREPQAVRPALTWFAQVYAPRDIPRIQKFGYELLYSRRQNLWPDPKLIPVSFCISFRRKWEVQARKF